MNKEFIPYEQALALKELEFNEPCFALYDEYKIFEYNAIPHNGNILKCCISAPLYQQAFRWFRVEHNLVVSQDRDGGWWMFSIKTIFDEDNEGAREVSDGFITKDSYEEAELACLKKLIEIIKEKL